MQISDCRFQISDLDHFRFGPFQIRVIGMILESREIPTILQSSIYSNLQSPISNLQSPIYNLQSEISSGERRALTGFHPDVFPGKAAAQRQNRGECQREGHRRRERADRHGQD